MILFKITNSCYIAYSACQTVENMVGLLIEMINVKHIFKNIKLYENRNFYNISEHNLHFYIRAIVMISGGRSYLFEENA